jgi:NADH dehydrogenase
LSITVVEGGERLVPAARPDHSAYVERYLARRGVRLLLGTAVRRVEPHAVELSDGRTLPAFTIVWTAGVTPQAFVRELPLLHHGDGRVCVDETLRALRPDGTPFDDLYVIGDCAASKRDDGRMQPQLSQTAIAMGTHVGRTLVRRAQGLAPERFSFRDVGYIISLGKHSSVLDLFGVPLSGKLAWLAWAGAYLVKMVGFRKQLEVGIDHLTHLLFEHDTSQILNRRAVLTDDELNLALGDDSPATGAASRAADPAPASPPQTPAVSEAPAEPSTTSSGDPRS